MVKLKTQEYIAKYSAEFPDGRINRELPFPTDTISVVSDPKNWHCYPENVVRIYLSNYGCHKIIVGQTYVYCVGLSPQFSCTT
ncbi:hypothetical protein GNE08_29740 (plasmid) [Trichormus variabilis ARAD]|uniref:Uncharacterized protein n=1 Tax=Trichormus variabilis N2B TaxID=2681315 RepID=A0ABR6SHH6_ANAVA|nr:MULTISPECIES: hypothetical protein [Nostocaceae]MBC1218352.1 hypothetical protein [Trichormus variabilis ARAD]MBC1259632.1 hypothetical protein [Trichormus variabilis V5]MBC1271138.1 hypothetical protein [Trichormus variabilis FSR]MBC1305836.1 hypothetical protein [Trichormus variabilis N2B]MBC1315097.1 hypothetical protein [Trichormus variabilis PNB]